MREISRTMKELVGKQIRVTWVKGVDTDYRESREGFPGGPVVRSPPQCKGAGSIPSRGPRIPHMPWENWTHML